MNITTIKEKYGALSLPVKASLWYTVCNVINKGLAVLSTPIFTRIMTANTRQNRSASADADLHNCFTHFLHDEICKKLMIEDMESG